MTFEASRNDGFVEMRRPVGITRTIDPRIKFGPITDWQFKEPVILPKQVGLPLPAGPDHQINTLGVRDRLRGCNFLHRTLEKPVFAGTHGVMQIRVRSSENIRSRTEFTQNRMSARQTRREVMCGYGVCFRFFFVTRTARRISHVGLRNILIMHRGRWRMMLLCEQSMGRERSEKRRDRKKKRQKTVLWNSSYQTHR